MSNLSFGILILIYYWTALVTMYCLVLRRFGIMKQSSFCRFVHLFRSTFTPDWSFFFYNWCTERYLWLISMNLPLNLVSAILAMSHLVVLILCLSFLLTRFRHIVYAYVHIVCVINSFLCSRMFIYLISTEWLLPDKVIEFIGKFLNLQALGFLVFGR